MILFINLIITYSISPYSIIIITITFYILFCLFCVALEGLLLCLLKRINRGKNSTLTEKYTFKLGGRAKSYKVVNIQEVSKND